MDKDIKIAPSILASDFANLGNEIKEMDRAGCDWFHIDVMDGLFVPNISFGASIQKSIRGLTKKVFDTHLMISNPDKYIGDFADAGSEIITIHAESTNHLHRSLELIKQHNIKAGVAINPATPISVIENVLDLLDLILVMTVNPGFGGQLFIESQIEKISRVRDLIEKRNNKIYLEVDGGINNLTSPKCINAGANVLVAGSYLFKNKKEDYKKAIISIK